MELRIEAIPGQNLPSGCFVGVRVGEVLKQGRYDPSCCYRFPGLERQRNAKIDLYQHLGTCHALVDPDIDANNEVKISGCDPGIGDLRFKVVSKPDGGKPREERKTEVKKQAKDYLGRHGVEERLCAAVKALIAAQPEDPTEFLVAHLRESCPKKAPDKEVSVAPKDQQAPQQQAPQQPAPTDTTALAADIANPAKVAKPESSSTAMLPFAEHYQSQHWLPDASMKSIYSQFQRKTEATAPAVAASGSVSAANVSSSSSSQAADTAGTAQQELPQDALQKLYAQFDNKHVPKSAGPSRYWLPRDAMRNVYSMFPSRTIPVDDAGMNT